MSIVRAVVVDLQLAPLIKRTDQNDFPINPRIVNKADPSFNATFYNSSLAEFARSKTGMAISHMSDSTNFAG